MHISISACGDGIKKFFSSAEVSKSKWMLNENFVHFATIFHRSEFVLVFDSST